MKKLFVLFGILALSSFLAIQCSDDEGGGSAQNPTEAIQDFDTLTVKITEESAPNIINQLLLVNVVEKVQANIDGMMPTRIQIQPRIASLKAMKTKSLVEEGTCNPLPSGSFTLSFDSSDPKNPTANLLINNVKMDCEDDSLDLTCNGNIRGTIPNYDTTNETVVACLDMSCTVEGQEKTADACIKEVTSGETTTTTILVDGIAIDPSGIVVTDTCSSICVPITDSDGKKTITCNVPSYDADLCEDGLVAIEQVDNCVVATAEACPI